MTAAGSRVWAGMMVSASGALLERSIVDRMVGGPERLVFEGGPVLVPPLQQDKESRRPIAVDGEMLDTVAACPPLTIVERARLDELKAKERTRLAPEVAKAKAAFIERQAKKLAERTGIPEHAAKQDRAAPMRWRAAAGHRAAVRRPGAGRMHRRRRARRPGALRGSRRWPIRWKASTTGLARRRSCAGPTARRGSTRSPTAAPSTSSSTTPPACARRWRAAAKEEVVATFARLAAGADLDAVELEELRQLAKEALRRRPAGDRRRAQGAQSNRPRRSSAARSAPAPRGATAGPAAA